MSPSFATGMQILANIHVTTIFNEELTIFNKEPGIELMDEIC